MSHSDTSPEAAEILRERMRRLTPSQRILEGEKLCKLSRQFMRAGIRMRHPDYDEEHVESITHAEAGAKARYSGWASIATACSTGDSPESPLSSARYWK